MMGHRPSTTTAGRVCPWPGPSFTEAGKGLGEPIPAATLTELDAKHWSSITWPGFRREPQRGAADNRAKLIEMVTQWYVEAGKYNVLPVDAASCSAPWKSAPGLRSSVRVIRYYPAHRSVSTSGSGRKEPSP